jgi:predicted dehydrogenase
MSVLRAGVAGAGVFGRHHAGKFASLPGVRLAAVYDHVLEHAAALAAGHGAVAFDDYAAFLDAVEAVTIASPADTHADFAQAALQAGRHAYVEKPLSVFGGDARYLVDTARERGLVLAVGHQERVVFEAMGLFRTPERPTRIEAVRLGTPSPRNRDVSCVLDVMIHDLDLALALCGSAAGVSGEGTFDQATAEVAFEGGASGRFEVSRMAGRRERKMRLTYPSGVVEIDFLAPSFADGAGLGLDPGFAASPAGEDPLGTSVAAFVAAVRGEAARPVVTGEEGAQAVELAVKVEAAIGV